MDTSRIKNLFRPNSETERLTDILTACCNAASESAGRFRWPHCQLTERGAVFDIDDVMRHLALDFGTPQRPDIKKKYPIKAVLDTIHDLDERGFLINATYSFGEIRLTVALFYAIAEATCYAKGLLPHKDGNSTIYSLSAHNAGQQRRREVSHA